MRAACPYLSSHQHKRQAPRFINVGQSIPEADPGACGTHRLVSAERTRYLKYYSSLVARYGLSSGGPCRRTGGRSFSFSIMEYLAGRQRHLYFVVAPQVLPTTRTPTLRDGIFWILPVTRVLGLGHTSHTMRKMKKVSEDRTVNGHLMRNWASRIGKLDGVAGHIVCTVVLCTVLEVRPDGRTKAKRRRIGSKVFLKPNLTPRLASKENHAAALHVLGAKTLE